MKAFESKHINLTETLTRKTAHCCKQMGALDAELPGSLSLLSGSGKGSAVLLSRGGKYGSCQWPYDAASAVYTQKQTLRLMARTQRHKRVLLQISECETQG